MKILIILLASIALSSSAFANNIRSNDVLSTIPTQKNRMETINKELTVADDTTEITKTAAKTPVTTYSAVHITPITKNKRKKTIQIKHTKHHPIHHKKIHHIKVSHAKRSTTHRTS